MIEETKWYSISELTKLGKEGFLPFRGRQTWIELIKAGKLRAIVKGNPTNKTYLVEGVDLLNYLNELKGKTSSVSFDSR